ncbi:6-phosphogluconate dehydrogenase (decarboxylating) [Anaerovirgula multivorans]|uniref:6-phosphogluconate dehydrogenase, decarboxylating n=1 Tax=Anaerovirgula multivorans TaxID=312168 RepID=A0A239CDH4_9FIRM|nr:NADP-dependent phosphogluconate dehydrogenase [Anaerovirgula multivorans]SNS17718.1 6-phosphogluconate dehydrogenase (decarboxylating) [Anaerovirgula multivorans]
MYEIAIYGLGVMGSSLAKNLLNKGFSVALFSKNEEEGRRFVYEALNENWKVFSEEKTLLSSLTSPRIIFLMITAGEPVDIVIKNLSPYLKKGDIIIDGGNSYFKDTSRRTNYLKELGIFYLGIGVSGGEKGALTGPSMMVGGSLEGWEASRYILQKIAAHLQGESCCNYVGPEGAGHYVKMVHNGIEYAILQLIADTYAVMKRGLGLDHEIITKIFSDWKSSQLNSYLIDITASVLSKRDSDGAPLVDKILDVARQKGTGSWTLEEAVAREVYVPTICESVFARYFSANRQLRIEGNQMLTTTVAPMQLEDYNTQLKDTLLAGIICSYAQGIELIQKASIDYGWNIDLVSTVSLWRDGCIIRSQLLQDIVEALMERKQNILLTKKLSYITALEPSWRETITQVQNDALAVPTLISTLSYYDCFHTDKMSVNIVQALRDCFGAHTYERIDKEGYFHTNWE